MNPPHNAGFSLIELMCAIVILGVALVGLTEGITTALRSNKESELHTEAALLAAAQVETIRAQSDWSDGVTQGDCGAELPNYEWRQTIAPSDIGGLHEVTVAVRKSGSDDPLYELRTLLFDPNYPGSDQQTGRTEQPKRRRQQ